MGWSCFLLFWCLCGLGAGCARLSPPPMQRQFPSPMRDSSRSHARLADIPTPGETFFVRDVLSRPIEVYVPPGRLPRDSIDLLIHFHGAAFVPRQAVLSIAYPLVLAVVNLGAGSSAYERPFSDPAIFPAVLRKIAGALPPANGRQVSISACYLSSFSAGYGAVRAILRFHPAQINGILLLDGLHTDYLPEGKVLAEGGRLNEEKLRDFLKFAREAAAGRKKLWITHSEIFPGTYASTTETADYLIGALALQRTPVLQWGPGGMQLLSETRKKELRILGFAGNTAPDHVDHLHGLPAFLAQFFGGG